MKHSRRIKVAEGEDRYYKSVEEFMQINSWAKEVDDYLYKTNQPHFWALSNSKKYLYLIVKYLNFEHKNQAKAWQPIEEKYLPNLHNGWGYHKGGDGKGNHFRHSKYRKDYLKLRTIGEENLDPNWCKYK